MTLRVALAQLNLTVGDLEGNRRRVDDGIRRALAWRADLVVMPELAITGYPPEDLLLKPAFVDDNRKALAAVQAQTGAIAALVGFVDRDAHGRLYNAVAILSHGRRIGLYYKQCLPNYGVFDEERYFVPGDRAVTLELRGARIGLTICEDLWCEEPVKRLGTLGCDLLVNVSASPYHAGKLYERQALFARRAREHRAPIAYCNLVGGQDELVFDGASFVLDAEGRLLARGRQFREDLIVADIELPSKRAAVVDRPPLPLATRRALQPLEEIYDALVLGTRDYIEKNGFKTVVLGMSGGIDSSLTACIAADAVGPERVVGVVMPSRFSSAATQADARRACELLGIRCEELPIEPGFTAYLETLRPLFGGGSSAPDVAEQNLQARIRGTLLMALSNKFGWLVLTTGNKSEMATGYCTLYGDMAGGFAVIKDVPKTLVYRLARWRNGRSHARPIPQSVIDRVPTAELAPNQTDQDTLPPYEVLDRIVQAYVEEDRSVAEMIDAGDAEPEIVRKVVRMVDRSEYKRRQAPPGVKITPKAFGRDRRMPITNRYEQE